MADTLKKLGDKTQDAQRKPAPDDDHSMTVKAGPLKPEDYLSRYGTEAAVSNRPEASKSSTEVKPVPVYDKGGDVSIEASRRLQSSGDAGIQNLVNAPDEQPLKPLGKPAASGNTVTGDIHDVRKDLANKATSKVTTDRGDDVKQSTYMVGGGANEKAPAMPVMSLDATKAPLYDEGGDVDVNDGKHQVAILKDGEKVLTPEQAAQYREEHKEERGAPAGFPGMVLPNPSGVKVHDSDVQEPKASDTDRLPKGAKVSTDSAPLKTPDGDVSNPVAADVKPEMMRESSTLNLKPYGKVMDEKANAKAAEMASAEPSGEGKPAPEGGAAPPAPKEEKPKITYGHILADQWLQRNGMPSMDSLMAPKEFNQGGAPQPAQGAPQQGGAPAPQGNTPAPQGGLKPIVNPNPAATGKEAFHQKMAEYDKQYQAAMDKAAQTNDPQYREQAARIKEAQLSYEKQHPWGSKESAHPGVLGKLGHVGEEVASRTPIAGINQIAATVPGSEMYRKQEGEHAREQVKEASAENAQDNKKSADATDWRPVAGSIGPNGRVMLLNSKTSESKEAPEGFTPYDKPAHLGDQATYIEQWYNDHPDAPKSTTNDDKAIEQYGAAKASAAEQNKAKGKIYYYDTPTGRQGYTYGEAQAAGLKPEDGYAVSSTQADKDRKSNDTYESLKTQLHQYRDNIGKSDGQLLPTDVDNMASMVESVEAPDYISKITSGILDDAYGKPVTGYNEKVMKGVLTKKAYESMSPTARKLVADYFTTLLAHFGNVKATLGQVPRNEKLITTEMNMIPKPYLNAKEAEPAFSDYEAQVERNNVHNVKFGKAQASPEANKAETSSTEENNLLDSIKMPDGSKPAKVAKAANGHVLVWSGKEGDPWIDPTAATK